jgi:hypothetical protein
MGFQARLLPLPKALTHLLPDIMNLPRISLLTISLLATSTLATPAQPPESAHLLRAVTGDDWSLPPDVRPTPNTGFGWVEPEWVRRWTKLYPVDEDDGLSFCEYVFFNWADVNPEPGVYDWETVDREIERIARVPHLGFALWPRIYARSNVNGRKGHGTGRYDGEPMLPRWLEQQENVRYMPDGTVMHWRPDSGYVNALRPFLAELGRRYRELPRFLWVECRYNDPCWGEGGWRAGREEFARAERECGLSSERIEAAMLRFIDAWAEAFRGVEDRVVLSNWGPNLYSFAPAYREASERIWQHAIKRGFGGRDGQVEVWYRYMTAGYGITVDPDGYMILDEDYPPIKENRVWHTENENYLTGGNNWNAKFGPDSLAEYRWFASNLRLLQMRRNWVTLLWTEEGIDGGWAALKWPDMARYVQLSLGKTAETSPDAWCWLREGYAPGQLVDPPRSGTAAIRNFERWLIQRDVAAGGRTQPTAEVDISHMGQWAARGDHEFQARRTDIASGQDSIYFQAARRWFGSSSQPVRLFVSYRDDPDVAWHVEYETPSGPETGPTIKSGGSGEWQTASLFIPAMRCAGTFADGMDFRLVAAGRHDAVVRLVRLAKWP